MRGSRTIRKRELTPDLKYGHVLVAKLINYVMRNGKKETAARIVYDAFAEIEKKLKKDPVKVFEQALNNAAPLLEVKARRIGGATYQVPSEVRKSRQIELVLRWMTAAMRKHKGQASYKSLASEIFADFNNEGEACRKKAELHKLAQANKAFAHYARF